MEVEFGDVGQLSWLWLVATVVLIVGVSNVRTRTLAKRFVTQNLMSRVVPPGRRWRQGVASVLAAGMMLLLVVSLVDLRWGRVWREVPQKGIEVVFLLDVSRSMLAEDATPNRLSRAKQQIKDIIDEMSGDRIGLVLFAGEVRQFVPLTSHYDDFRQSLDTVGPHNLDRGGSRLGDAIHVAADSFLSKTTDHKAIVIFSDGEDQESKPQEAASRALSEQGIRIYTVGLGDAGRGARIPVEGVRGMTYLRHDGQEVWSRLDGEILKQVADNGGGLYVPAGTKQVNMADLYRRSIASIDQTEFETARIQQFEARFQWFLGPAILLLLIEIFVSTGRRRRQGDSDAAARPGESTGQGHGGVAQGESGPARAKGEASSEVAAERGVRAMGPVSRTVE